MGTQGEEALLSLAGQEICVDENCRKRGHVSCHEVEEGVTGRRYSLCTSPMN